jgi:hypothetical protein
LAELGDQEPPPRVDGLATRRFSTYLPTPSLILGWRDQSAAGSGARAFLLSLPPPSTVCMRWTQGNIVAPLVENSAAQTSMHVGSEKPMGEAIEWQLPGTKLPNGMSALTVAIGGKPDMTRTAQFSRE